MVKKNLFFASIIFISSIAGVTRLAAQDDGILDPPPPTDPSDGGSGSNDGGSSDGGDNGSGTGTNPNCQGLVCSGSAGVALGGKVSVVLNGDLSFGVSGTGEISGGANLTFAAMWKWSCTDSTFNRGLYQFSTSDCRYNVNGERRFVPDAKNIAVAAVSNAMVEFTGKVTGGLGVGGNNAGAGQQASITAGLTGLSAEKEVDCRGKTGSECAIIVADKITQEVASSALPAALKNGVDLYLALTGKGELNRKLNQVSSNAIGTFTTFTTHFRNCLWEASDFSSGICD
jgi:hypothetical protein